MKYPFRAKLLLNRGIVGAVVAGITAPVLTKTSAANFNPIAFDVAVDSTVAVGMYWHLQVASDSGFVTVTRDETLVITNDNYVNADASFASLKSMADGATFVRLRVERDDGVNSPWSNTVSDTLSSKPVVTFNPATVSQYTTLSNGNLTTTCNNNNQREGARATAGKAYGGSNDRGYFEVVYVSGLNPPIIGISNSTASLQTTGAPGQDTPGIGLSGRYLYKDGVNTADLGGSWNTVGEVIGIYFVALDATNFKAWFSLNGVWSTLTGDPSASGVGYAFTLASGVGFAQVATMWGGGSVTSATARFSAASQTNRGTLASYGA